MAFATYMKNIRLDREESQVSMAKRMNISVTALKLIENGTTKFPSDKLLEESYVRNDLFLRYCVLSNLTLSSLLKKDFNDGFVYIGMIDQKYLNDDYDLILYQIMLYFFSNDYISTKNHIRKALGNTSISSYYKNFFQGIKYLMDNKFIKAIDRIERCYDLALSDGEVDRSILDLKLLNELYLDHGLQNKLKKVKELQENFYKMSYANQIIEDIVLKLN